MIGDERLVKDFNPKFKGTRSRTWVAAAAFAALGSCVTPATEVMVEFDSNAPADRLLTVSVRVSNGTMTGDGGGTRTWVHGTQAAESIGLPASFAIVPGEGRPRNGTVSMVIDAQLASGPSGGTTLVFQRRARFAFIPNHTTTLPIYLNIGCGAQASDCNSMPASQCTVAIRCAEQNLTCGNEGRCVSVDVEPIDSRDAQVSFGDIASPPADAGLDADDGSDVLVPADAMDAGDATTTSDAGDASVMPDAGGLFLTAGGIDTTGLVGAGTLRITKGGLESGPRTCVGALCLSGGITP